MKVDEVIHHKKEDGEAWDIVLKPAKTDQLPTGYTGASLKLKLSKKPTKKSGDLVDVCLVKPSQTTLEFKPTKAKREQIEAAPPPNTEPPDQKEVKKKKLLGIKLFRMHLNMQFWLYFEGLLLIFALNH